MAQKRKQIEQQPQQQQQQQQQLEPKRMKTNRTTNQRNTIQNQLMAQAALARINKNNNNNDKKKNNQNIKQEEEEEEETTQNQQTSTTNPPSPPDQIQKFKLEIDNLNKTITTYKAVLDSQTSLIDSIKSSLSCNICFEIIDSPYALLCGHIFCHKDLYSWFHRSNSSLSAQRDHHHHHHHHHNHHDHHDDDSDHDSSDSERIGSALSQTIIPAGGRRAITNETRAEQTGVERGTNQTNQEARVVILDGRTNENGSSQTAHPPPARLQPISPRRKRQNLICPQCRAPVTGRPISLYAIKEVTTQLKSSEPPASASACASASYNNVPVPIPSSSNSNSFRNLVELHRDEKDLTWGNLFPSNLNNNSTGATQELARFIIDPHDGVRRCGNCAWEIGRDGYCAGCGAEYPDYAEDDTSSSDSSFQMQSEESYMRTDYSEGDIEGEETDRGSIDSGRFGWSGPVGRVGLAWMDDGQGSDDEEEEESSNGSSSSDEVRVIAGGGHARRNVIRVSSGSEEEDDRYRPGPPSDGGPRFTRYSNSSSSIQSRRAESIHSSRPEYISSDDHAPNRSEGDHWGRTTSDDEDEAPPPPRRNHRAVARGDRWMRSSSDSHEHLDSDGSVMIREVVHFRPGSERSFGTPESSSSSSHHNNRHHHNHHDDDDDDDDDDDCDQWSGIHRIDSDYNDLPRDYHPDHHNHHQDQHQEDDDDDEYHGQYNHYHSDNPPSSHDSHWETGDSMDDHYH